MSNEQIVAAIQDGIDEKDNMLQLWEKNHGMIRNWVNKYVGYAEREDLEQECYFGLYEAVKRYKADQGALFMSYAEYWIKQAMQRYIENHGRTVRVPAYLVQLENKYGRIESEFEKIYGREPSESELCHLLGIEREKLQEIKKSRKMVHIMSLEAPIGEGTEDITVADTVASEEDIEERCNRRFDYNQMKKVLWETVDNLPDDQGEVIRKRYQDQMTLKEVGQQLGLGIAGARKIEEKGMRTLRIPSKSRKYKTYFDTYLRTHTFHHVGLEQFNNTWTSEVEREVLRR